MDLDYYGNIYHQNAASAEILVIRELSKRQLNGHKFRRKICEEPFVVEFICNELQLIVELYSELDLPNAATEARIQKLHNHGFQVARFSHGEVLGNLPRVIESISAVVRQSKKAVTMSQLACRYLAGGFGKVRQTALRHSKKTPKWHKLQC